MKTLKIVSVYNSNMMEANIGQSLSTVMHIGRSGIGQVILVSLLAHSYT